MYSKTFKLLKSKFTSRNSVPVERVTLRRSEYQIIMSERFLLSHCYGILLLTISGYLLREIMDFYGIYGGQFLLMALFVINSIFLFRIFFIRYIWKINPARKYFYESLRALKMSD